MINDFRHQLKKYQFWQKFTNQLPETALKVLKWFCTFFSPEE